MSIFKKLTAGLLSVIMIISLAACSDTTWAAKSGDTTIPAGVYIYYQMQAVSEAKSKMTSTTADLFKSKIEDKDAKVWIADKVEEYLKSYVAANNKFDEMKLTLTDEDNAKIETSLNNFWSQNEKLMTSNGIGESSIKLIVTASYKTQMIYDKYYAKGGIEEVTDEQVAKYFDENNARVKYIAIQLKDGEGNLFKTADKEKAMAMAKDYVEKAKTTSFDKLIDEYTEYYTKLVKDATEKDPTDVLSSKSATEGDYQCEAILTKDSKDPSENVVKKAFEMSPSDTPVIVEDQDVYYVLQRLDTKERKDLLESSRDSIVYSLKGEDFTKLQEEWEKNVTITPNEDSYKRYKPENIKLKLE